MNHNSYISRGGFLSSCAANCSEGRAMDHTPCPDVKLSLARARREGGSAVGELLEHYRHYLYLLARARMGRQLQGRVDPSDLVQEAFLAAHRDFAAFRGTTEAELVCW